MADKREVINLEEFLKSYKPEVYLEKVGNQKIKCVRVPKELHGEVLLPNGECRRLSHLEIHIIMRYHKKTLAATEGN